MLFRSCAAPLAAHSPLRCTAHGSCCRSIKWMPSWLAFRPGAGATIALALRSRRFLASVITAGGRCSWWRALCVLPPCLCGFAGSALHVKSPYASVLALSAARLKLTELYHFLSWAITARTSVVQNLLAFGSWYNYSALEIVITMSNKVNLQNQL